MRILFAVVTAAFLISSASAAEKKVQLKDLPPAVQKSIQDQTKGAEIRGITSETDKGKVTYEVETMMNGKHRDITFDAKGTLAELEEETAIDAIPAAAKAALEKKAAGGKIGMVETVTRGATVYYEAQYTDKAGKQHEYAVNAGGTPVKD